MSDTNPLDILKRLDVKQNVTIRVIDEPTGKVVQEHIGHNAATNSLLTGIAHYLMGDGVLNQGQDTLSMWIPQYISVGTMGLTSQRSETITVGEDTFEVPSDIGYTPVAPRETNLNFETYGGEATYPITLESARDVIRVYVNDIETSDYSLDYSANTITFDPVPADGADVNIIFQGATTHEKELNAQLRFSEYINQAPGFGADGYDSNSNNNREWFGLGYPYTLKPDAIRQDFHTWDGSEMEFFLMSRAEEIVSVTLYPDGEVNQDISDTSVTRRVLSTEGYQLNDNHYIIHLNEYPEEEPLPTNTRIAIIYTIKSEEAANCELISAKIDKFNNIVPVTLRSKITYRDLVPEIQSEVPNTLDVIYSAFISVGALKAYRGKDVSDDTYIYITEAGLWSKPSFTDSGDNGLLAGYRIMPSDDEVNVLGVEKILKSTGEDTYTFTETFISIDSITCDGVIIPDDYYYFKATSDSTTLTFTDVDHIPAKDQTLIIVFRTGDAEGTWKDMTILENRQKVQQSIIRIGVNQVAQIIWKIQLGGLEQLNGLRYLYPPQYVEDVWTIV